MATNGRMTHSRREIFRAHADGFDIILGCGGNIDLAIAKLRGLYNRRFADRSQTSFLDFFWTLCLAYQKWIDTSSIKTKAA